MSRVNLRRFPLVLMAVIATWGIAAWGVTTPAHAGPDTGVITGHLTDNGAAVAGANVGIDGPSYIVTSTDENGFYQVTDLAPGDYRVSFHKDGRTYQYAHQKLSWETADLFAVAAGAETVVDDALLPTGTITGRLTKADGSAVSGWVTAQSVANGDSVSTSMDGNGTYTLRPLPGQYRVQFTVGNQYQYVPSTRDEAQATVFNVVVGQTVTADDTLLPGGSVAGRVTRPDGSPAADLHVSLEDPRYGSAGSATTNANGEYRLDNVFAGSYTVGFRLPSGATQYAHQKRNQSQAQLFAVTADTVTTVDEVLLPTGSVAGRFVDGSGAGVAGVQVHLTDDANEGDGGNGYTDSNGDWRIDDVFAGGYRVFFSSWEAGIGQYAYGTTDSAKAARIVVSGGQTSTVNDTQLPTGSVRITAKDAVTGARINSFWADAGGRSGNTDNGEVVLSDVIVGSVAISVGADGYLYRYEAATVTVVAGTQVDVEVPLTPDAKITTTVVDTVTGAPVAGVCVFTATAQQFRLPEGCQFESDAAGKVVLYGLAAGTYELFAAPARGDGYGAQWVGKSGGTGSQLQARRVAVKTGQTVELPKIKMDKAGTVTGIVTGANGTPMEWARVAIGTSGVGSGGDVLGDIEVGPDGRYTVDWLGPYQWPLRFQGKDHAPQWSGGVANRYLAQTIKVTSGASTTYDYQLKQGTEVKVVITDAPSGGFASVYNANTGDIMGVGWADDLTQGATFRVLGPQTVKVRHEGNPGGGWYGGADFAHAKTVFIPAQGTRTVTFAAG